MMQRQQPKQKQQQKQKHSAITGMELGKQLIEAGVIDPLTTRVTIDMSCDDMVAIYTEKHGDQRLLKIDWSLLQGLHADGVSIDDLAVTERPMVEGARTKQRWVKQALYGTLAFSGVWAAVFVGLRYWGDLINVDYGRINIWELGWLLSITAASIVFVPTWYKQKPAGFKTEKRAREPIEYGGRNPVSPPNRRNPVIQMRPKRIKR